MFSIRTLLNAFVSNQEWRCIFKMEVELSQEEIDEIIWNQEKSILTNMLGVDLSATGKEEIKNMLTDLVGMGQTALIGEDSVDSYLEKYVNALQKPLLESVNNE